MVRISTIPQLGVPSADTPPEGLEVHVSVGILRGRVRSDDALRSLATLPSGLYLWEALASALAEQGAHDPASVLADAVTRGAVTLLRVTVTDSDGDACDDRLVQVDARRVAGVLGAPTTAQQPLRARPLPTETITPPR